MSEKRGIPSIRTDLFALARRISEAGHLGFARELRQLTMETVRVRSPHVRAPRKQKPITPAEVLEVRRLKALHPMKSQREISDMMNFQHPGRVSEILSGKNGVPCYDEDGNYIATDGRNGTGRKNDE